MQVLAGPLPDSGCQHTKCIILTYDQPPAGIRVLISRGNFEKADRLYKVHSCQMARNSSLHTLIVFAHCMLSGSDPLQSDGVWWQDFPWMPGYRPVQEHSELGSDFEAQLHGLLDAYANCGAAYSPNALARVATLRNKLSSYDFRCSSGT